ncbi:glycosyl hydrolase [Pseudomassariella vexata]|uniref:Glycosyl hydrolase n=1 Tax=Pseudomassariella vexata TaxID=1141098 RepID=A0A1Y2E3H8_9PEZI|nr:glycosyl hydrolase [Pseudomassariella vexata]ORY65997.1 glycosyl hydrolase [Pseudomassariella vexata]
MSSTATRALAYPTTAISSITRVDNIPASTVQCHASNLLQLPDKTLLCTWFGGTQEGIPDISIYLSRLAPGPSSSWSTPVKVSSDPTRSEQNPILFRDPATGTIWLFHTAQPAGNQDEAVVIARTSTDNAVTWSAPYELLPGHKGAFVRQPLVVLEDGTWVLPFFYCRTPPGFRWIGSDDVSAVMHSRDGGKMWDEKLVPNSRGAVHMNIVKLPSKREYVAFFRSRWADCIYRSTSKDGINWEAPANIALPNPNSGICAAALSGGEIVMVFNDSKAEEGLARREGLYDDIAPADDKRVNQPGVGGKSAVWGTPRKALSIGLSKDDGKTWKYRVLEDGDGFCMTNDSKGRSNRELSYPSIFVETGAENQRSIHVAYTFFRQNIKYIHISDVEEYVNGEGA